jgi:hypothetical protein
MTTLQDIMGLISKRKIKTPTDKDYIISAAYTDTQEVLKPQPKMEPSLINIGALKKFITTGNQYFSTGLFSQTGNSIIVTGTTESTLIDGGVGTLNVPANGFQVGHSYRAVFGGVMNAANNQRIRIRVEAGPIVLLDSGFQNLGSSVIDDIWSLNVDFTIRQIGAAGVASIVSLGTFHYTKTNNASIQGFAFNVVNNTTFDTTISNVLNVTAQWESANVENNIYSDIFVLNKTY